MEYHVMSFPAAHFVSLVHTTCCESSSVNQARSELSPAEGHARNLLRESSTSFSWHVMLTVVNYVFSRIVWGEGGGIYEVSTYCLM